MKNILIIIGFLFVLSMSAQKQKATIFLKDGTQIKGFAKITGGDQIKFRSDKKSKKKLYNYESVKKLIIRKNDTDIEYRYKIVEGKNSVKLLELIEEGYITLFRDLNEGYSPGGFGAGGMMIGGGRSYSISHYYVSKDNNESVTHLGSKGSIFSKNFKKAATEYFKNCPKLVQKIQDKEYKKRDIVEIVEYYNENCE